MDGKNLRERVSVLESKVTCGCEMDCMKSSPSQQDFDDLCEKLGVVQSSANNWEETARIYRSFLVDISKCFGLEEAGSDGVHPDDSFLKKLPELVKELKNAVQTQA
jgi:hypothetical protein